MHELDTVLPQRLRITQIIAAAILLGLLIFLAIDLFIVYANHGGQGQFPPDNFPIISLIALGMLVLNIPLAILLPAAHTETMLRQIVAGTWQAPPGWDPAAYSTVTAKLLSVWQTALIFRYALLEGVGALGCIAHLLEARPFALAIVGVVVLLLLCFFPTEARRRSWLERQADRMAELRQQGVGPM